MFYKSVVFNGLCEIRWRKYSYFDGKPIWQTCVHQDLDLCHWGSVVKKVCKCFKRIVCFPAECWGKDIICRKQYHRGQVKNVRYDRKNLQIQQNGSTSILLYSSKYFHIISLDSHTQKNSYYFKINIIIGKQFLIIQRF